MAAATHGPDAPSQATQELPAWHFYAGLGFLFLGVVPAWALTTYPGWWQTGEGYFPYFNALAWQKAPSLFWKPPYLLADMATPWPLPEVLVALGSAAGLDGLAALRWSLAIGLMVAALGVYLSFSRVFTPWAALAASFSWVYAPYTLSLVYRLGHAREVWLWALATWLLWPLAQIVGADRLGRLGWLLAPPALAAWAPAAFPDWTFGPTASARALSPWWGLITLLSPGFVAWALNRWRLYQPVAVFVLAAISAQSVLPAARPAYIPYTPPPEPAAIFQGHGIVLLDVSLQGQLRPGETLYLSAHWQVLRPQQVNWTVFTQVLDDQNHIWGQFDGPVGTLSHPMSTWVVGEVREETYRLTISPDAPSDLRLIMGLYNLETMQRLPLIDGRDHVVVATTR